MAWTQAAARAGVGAEAAADLEAAHLEEFAGFRVHPCETVAEVAMRYCLRACLEVGVEGAFEVASAMPCLEVEPSRESLGAALDAYLPDQEVDRAAWPVDLGGRQVAGPAAGGAVA